ncbi:MAG: response regulator transcription factor [Deltaproteobacteria bacterium]|nr:response regulator transcription factor [Deltaproteobacteria bacterium]
MAPHILVVDDETDLATTLAYNLEREGFHTSVAESGKRALELAAETPPDLVILDLMLPDLSGVEVCRRLRQADRTRETPVIMLTAKGEEIDRVVGFEVGADDYVTKPFSVRELMLRIKAVLRRRASEPPQASLPSEELINFGGLRIDVPGHRVWVDDQEIRLTALEFRLLATFLARRGRVQTREILLNDVWGIEAEVTTRTVDTHVKRLREKLGSAGAYIETLRGVGYRMRPRPDEVEA